MKRIAFYLGNKNFQNADFKDIEAGSPGIGYSDYLPVALAYYLSKNYGDRFQTVLLSEVTANMPDGVVARKVDGIEDAVAVASSLNVDLFVFRTRINEEAGVLGALERHGVRAVGVAQLSPSPLHNRSLARCKLLDALVCVGREQYDALIDTPVHRKACVISNAVEMAPFRRLSHIQKDPHLVSYIGALTYQKGFQVLAEAWPKVLREVPSAKLSVIGSAKIYGENQSVGSFGVADQDFEQAVILRWLTDEKGRLIESVTLHGQMGQEKNELLARSSVGVANPTGQTETCCVSALEISASGTAVVSGAYYALLTSVQHKVTGLLGRTVDDLANNIIRLLKDHDLARKLGEGGVRYIDQNFSFIAVMPQWVELFDRISDETPLPKPTGGFRNIFRHRKYARMLNWPLQHTVGRILWWPSIMELEVTAFRLQRNTVFYVKQFVKSR